MKKLKSDLDKLSAKEEGRHKIKNGELLYCYRNNIRRICDVEEVLGYDTKGLEIYLTTHQGDRIVGIKLDKDSVSILGTEPIRKEL